MPLHRDYFSKYADWLYGLLFDQMRGVSCLKEKVFFAIIFNLLRDDIDVDDPTLSLIRKNVLVRGYLSTYDFKTAKHRLHRRYPFIEDSLVDYMFALSLSNPRAIYPELSAETFRVILDLIPDKDLELFGSRVFTGQLRPVSISKFRVNSGTFPLPQPGYDTGSGLPGSIRGVHITFTN
jgi:hypothetical protein